MPVVKINSMDIIPRPIILLYGQPGIGKTWLAAQEWNCIFICSDYKGADTLKHAGISRDILIVNHADDLREIYTNYLSEIDKYDGIVIDSLTSISNIFLIEGKTKNPGNEIRAYGYTAAKSVAFLMEIIRKTTKSICALAGVDYVFSEKEEKHQPNKPAAAGNKFGYELSYLFPEMWYLGMEGRDRVLYFETSTIPGYILAKSRAGITEPAINPTSLTPYINRIYGK